MSSASDISAPITIVHQLKDKEAQQWGRFIWSLEEKKKRKKKGEEAWSNASRCSCSSRTTERHSIEAQGDVRGVCGGRKDRRETRDRYRENGVSEKSSRCVLSVPSSSSRSASPWGSSRSSTVDRWSTIDERGTHAMGGVPTCTTASWERPLEVCAALPVPPMESSASTAAVPPADSSPSSTATFPPSPMPPRLRLPQDDALHALWTYLYHLSFSPLDTLRTYEAVLQHHFHDTCHRCYHLKVRLQKDLKDMCMAVVQASLASASRREATRSSRVSSSVASSPVEATHPSWPHSTTPVPPPYGPCPRAGTLRDPSSPLPVNPSTCSPTPSSGTRCPPSWSRRMAHAKNKKKNKTTTSSSSRVQVHTSPPPTDGRPVRHVDPTLPSSPSTAPHRVRSVASLSCTEGHRVARPIPSLASSCHRPRGRARSSSSRWFWEALHTPWRQWVHRYAALCLPCRKALWSEVWAVLAAPTTVEASPSPVSSSSCSPSPTRCSLDAVTKGEEVEPSMPSRVPLRRSTTAPGMEGTFSALGRREEDVAWPAEEGRRGGALRVGATTPVTAVHLPASASVSRRPTTSPSFSPSHLIPSGEPQKLKKELIHRKPLPVPTKKTKHQNKKQKIMRAGTPKASPRTSKTPSLSPPRTPPPASRSWRGVPTETSTSTLLSPGRAVWTRRQKKEEEEKAAWQAVFQETVLRCASMDETSMTTHVVEGVPPFFPSAIWTPSSLPERSTSSLIPLRHTPSESEAEGRVKEDGWDRDEEKTTEGWEGVECSWRPIHDVHVQWEGEGPPHATTCGGVSYGGGGGGGGGTREADRWSGPPWWKGRGSCHSEPSLEGSTGTGRRKKRTEGGRSPERAPPASGLLSDVAHRSLSTAKGVDEVGDAALQYLLDTFALDHVGVERVGTVSPHGSDRHASATESLCSRRSLEWGMVSRVCVPPREARQAPPPPPAFTRPPTLSPPPSPHHTPRQTLSGTEGQPKDWASEVDRRLASLAMRWEHTEDWINRQHPFSSWTKRCPAQDAVAALPTDVLTGGGNGKEASVVSEDMAQLQKVLEPRVGSSFRGGGTSGSHSTKTSVGPFYSYAE